jgi:L-asparagine transporter-like permease
MDAFLYPALIVRLFLVWFIVDWKAGLAFRAYYYTGGFGNLVGFWAACCQAIFSYLGVEIIGIIAEETERQRETLPHAVRRIAFRGILYHVGAMFVLGLNVSANDPILKIMATQNYASPFVLMVMRAGIPALGHIINGVIIIALLGVANTRLYVSVCWHLKATNFRAEHCVLLPTKVRRLRSSQRPVLGTSRYIVWLSRLCQVSWLSPQSKRQQIRYPNYIL